jgi:sterol desaturase/sphingolipid hydroxylase (fatty acid hydroxylase superfamily)
MSAMHEARAQANADYRAHYRAVHAGPRYDGRRHAALVVATASGLIALLLWRAPPASTAMWLAVATLTLVVANVVEYWTHRGPMHHRTRWLRPMFERHARRHHRYFANGRMAITSHRDLHAVLFPPVLFLFFAVVAVAIGALLGLAIAPAAGYGFVISCLFYYLGYELLHSFYHLPGARRVAVFGYLARLHLIHHHHGQGRRMRNFNLTLPLCDWLHGTLDDDAAFAERIDPH